MNKAQLRWQEKGETVDVPQLGWACCGVIKSAILMGSKAFRRHLLLAVMMSKLGALLAEVAQVP